MKIKSSFFLIVFIVAFNFLNAQDAILHFTSNTMLQCSKETTDCKLSFEVSGNTTDEYLLTFKKNAIAYNFVKEVSITEGKSIERKMIDLLISAEANSSGPQFIKGLCETINVKTIMVNNETVLVSNFINYINSKSERSNKKRSEKKCNNSFISSH